MALAPGQRLGRFLIRHALARGGMAEVYLADQELVSDVTRPVALKVIRSEFAEDPSFREMFLDEARTAATLEHPNLVHIYEVGEIDGLLFLAMERVAGTHLAAIARALGEAGRRFSVEALLAIGIQACHALAAVHRHERPGIGRLGLVHRDVSPHNLLLTSSGVVKLIDFGIAKAAGNRALTRPGFTKGKAGYFSPEQARAAALDGRSDLFSLGVTLYELACGFGPFDRWNSLSERNAALLEGRWKPLLAVGPSLGAPEPFCAVVDRAMAVDRDERYADAEAMRAALRQVATGLGLKAHANALAGYVEANGAIRVDRRPVDLMALGPSGVERRASGQLSSGSGGPGSEPRTQIESGGAPTMTWPVAAPARARRGPTRRRLWGLAALVLAAAVVTGAGLGRLVSARSPRAPPTLQAETDAWHAQRIQQLTADDGWLTLAGLHWLSEGENLAGGRPGAAVPLPTPAPGELGTFTRRGDQVSFTPAAGQSVSMNGAPFAGGPLATDAQGRPDLLRAGRLQLLVIARGERLGVRVRDPEAKARRQFQGIERYPAREDWRKQARFEPAPPGATRKVPNVLGEVVELPLAGAAVFTHQGRTLKLVATRSEGALFFVFGDPTNGSETYGAGRFLDAELPRGDTVVLDFNRAYNPPCAFSPYATCPLPPRENRLPVRVEAGEKRYLGR